MSNRLSRVPTFAPALWQSHTLRCARLVHGCCWQPIPLRRRPCQHLLLLRRRLRQVRSEYVSRVTRACIKHSLLMRRSNVVNADLASDGGNTIRAHFECTSPFGGVACLIHRGSARTREAQSKPSCSLPVKPRRRVPIHSYLSRPSTSSPTPNDSTTGPTTDPTPSPTTAPPTPGEE